jgi:hypothetical protein
MNIKMVELTVERVVRSQLYLKLKMVKKYGYVNNRTILYLFYCLL